MAVDGNQVLPEKPAEYPGQLKPYHDWILC
jgi:hypothetical protein